jgi:hypothetical protein
MYLFLLPEFLIIQKISITIKLLFLKYFFVCVFKGKLNIWPVLEGCMPAGLSVCAASRRSEGGV